MRKRFCLIVLCRLSSALSLPLKEIPSIGSSPKDFQGITGIGSVWLDDVPFSWRYCKMFETRPAVEVRLWAIEIYHDLGVGV